MTDIGQVCRRPVFHDLDLPPFQNNVGLVPGVVTSGSSQSKSITIASKQVISVNRLKTENGEIYVGKSSNLNFRHTSLRLEGMSEIQAKKPLSKVAFLVILYCGN